MTMNDSWGFQRADDDWKSPKTVVRNLLTCTRGAGNYLLNIGPEGRRLHPAAVCRSTHLSWPLDGSACSADS